MRAEARTRERAQLRHELISLWRGQLLLPCIHQLIDGLHLRL